MYLLTRMRLLGRQERQVMRSGMVEACVGVLLVTCYFWNEMFMMLM